MELTNQTGIPAELQVTSRKGRERAGVLIVKSTFHIRDGHLELDMDDPAPVLPADEHTELGILPSDLLVPGMVPDFEIIVLGCAASARPVERMDVELRVGEHRARLTVTGDREWVRSGEQVAMSAPVPFRRMPLTWARAYGGSAEVWLDESARIPVQHPLNPEGRGFDAHAVARGLIEGGLTTEGKMRIDYVRQLPNVEDPDALITAPGDDPRPVCWATLPVPSLVLSHAGTAGPGEGGPRPRMMQRSHPDVTLTAAPVGQVVELRGCTVGGPLRFTFYPLALEADYVLGERTGVITPHPQRLVLLPEERRALVTSNAYFKFQAAEDEERSLRLRRRD